MDTQVKGGQELRLLPTTAWGRWAIGFAGAFFPLAAVFVVILATGPSGGAALSLEPRLIPGILAAASAAAALVTGLVAIIARHERSLLAFAAAGLGAAVTFFLVGEFLIPPYD